MRGSSAGFEGSHPRGRHLSDPGRRIDPHHSVSSGGDPNTEDHFRPHAHEREPPEPDRDPFSNDSEMGVPRVELQGLGGGRRSAPPHHPKARSCPLCDELTSRTLLGDAAGVNHSGPPAGWVQPSLGPRPRHADGRPRTAPTAIRRVRSPSPGALDVSIRNPGGPLWAARS